MDKAAVRRRMLKERSSLQGEFIQCASGTIEDRFWKEFDDYQRYLLYVDFDGEVATSMLTQKLVEKGKEVFLPILKSDEELDVGKYERSEKLKKNKFGIMEPNLVCEETVFDVAVIPGVAFDKACNRLGFGKGYYDRLLEKIHVSQSIGFAFEMQIVDELPSEAHDIPMDIVLTERNLYRRSL